MSARGPRADPAAAAERTRLAWRRTELAAGVVALLAARPALRPGAGPVPWLVAAAALAGWAALAGLGYRRARHLRAARPRPGHRTVPACALLAAALAVLAGVGVLTGAAR